MKTPASVWNRSPRRYDSHPPRWEYPSGAKVLKVSSEGQVKIQGHKWKISKALSGDWVQLVAVERRWLVFYCATLIREIDPAAQCSTIVEHWASTANS